ncbi:O-methyltransferase family 3 protein [Guyanagaster necrorhizus]|uniref:O-methyltransferase family 3 protein n=1 Tax=Guyanagaster necrorhizus TaxID=856835 RepID=A0A9P7VKN8_9AGAR|nr:O-methyltransferase family 3 protein [Guyanagaster necrorhizus MCA 3950]KAG7442888.1 O-methyltransferase family 3 protein [Guyanagaster necrorhizus MCA 3950]
MAHEPPTSFVDWDRSDKYHNSYLLQKDNTLEANIKNSIAKGLPDIAVSAAQGQFLNLLAKTIGAKRILEVGTLGGYSTTWLARSLPEGGELVTFELKELHAQVAAENLTKSGVASQVKIVLGPASESLAKVPSEPKSDLAFIDADKASILQYFTEAKRLVRPGGVIIVDNVVRNGRVADPSYSDGSVDGVRKLLAALPGDNGVEAITMGTVGEKGYDGFLYAIRK